MGWQAGRPVAVIGGLIAAPTPAICLGYDERRPEQLHERPHADHDSTLTDPGSLSPANPSFSRARGCTLSPPAQRSPYGRSCQRCVAIIHNGRLG